MSCSDPTVIRWGSVDGTFLNLTIPPNGLIAYRFEKQPKFDEIDPGDAWTLTSPSDGDLRCGSDRHGHGVAGKERRHGVGDAARISLL